MDDVQAGISDIHINSDYRPLPFPQS
jgi:hypothetical protein